MIREVHVLWLLTDTDPHPRELIRAEALDDGLEAIVTTRRATLPDPHATDSEVDVIRHHDDLLRRNLIEVRERRDAVARQVHVGQRLHDDELLRPRRRHHPCLRIDPLKLRLVQLQPAQLLAERLHRRETRIMTCTDIFLLRISQTRNQIHKTPPYSSHRSERLSRRLSEW